MKAEITGNIYENGKRVQLQRVFYEKSDDLYTLAHLHQRLERVRRNIDAATTESQLEALQAEKAKIEADIAEVQGYVDGYASAESEGA